jgi:hypothetical protein
MQKGSVVWNRDKTSKGFVTGSTKACRLSGCRGLCYAVKWPDGKTTWPCGKGIEYNRETEEWRIL